MRYFTYLLYTSSLNWEMKYHSVKWMKNSNIHLNYPTDRKSREKHCVAFSLYLFLHFVYIFSSIFWVWLSNYLKCDTVRLFTSCVHNHSVVERKLQENIFFFVFIVNVFNIEKAIWNITQALADWKGEMALFHCWNIYYSELVLFYFSTLFQ